MALAGMSLGNRIGLGFGGLVLIAMGALLFWMTNSEILLARASESWSSVDGTVESSGVSSTWVRQGRIALMNYAPAVKYTYSVGGTSYTGTRVGFSSEFVGAPGDTAKLNAETSAARWATGSSVHIFYDPGNPGESTLVQGGSVPTAFGGNLIAVVMCIGAFGCFFFAYRRG